MINYRPVLFPDEIFKRSPGKVGPVKALVFEHDIIYPEEGGIEIHIQGERYHRKGYPTPGIGYSVPLRNTKKLLIEAMSFFSSKPMRYFLPLFFFSNKISLEALEAFGRFSLNCLEELYFENPKYYCKSGREIWRMAMLSADRFSGRKKMIENIARFILTVWEFDTFYRYSGQAFFGLLDKKALRKNPAKEIIRIIDILISWEKDEGGMKAKWKKIRFPLMIFLKLKQRSIKDIIQIITDNIRLDELKLDEADYYHTLIISEFNYQGKSLEERMKIRKNLDENWGKN